MMTLYALNAITYTFISYAKQINGQRSSDLLNAGRAAA